MAATYDVIDATAMEPPTRVIDTASNGRPSLRDDQNHFHGWPIQALRSAFEKIENPYGWRLPLRFKVKTKSLGIACDAVVFFCGTPCFVESSSDDTITVVAGGYHVGQG